MKKLFTILLLVLSIGVLVACGETEGPQVTYYTVTFDTAGGNTIDSQEIRNGGKVTKPADPVKEGFLFTGVWKNGNFTWDFDIDIVVNDMTLVAQWLEISGSPTNISLTDDAFSSTITWQQTNADVMEFKVSLKPIAGSNFTEIQGDIDIETTSVMHVVTFTPHVIPQGGSYIVKIDYNDESVQSESLAFGGAGTVLNPYLIMDTNDVMTMLEDESLSDKHFKQMNDVLSTLSDSIEITDTRKIEFSGVYDGGNFQLSFTGNGGLFHKILPGGLVKNLNITSSTQLYAASTNAYAIGAVADFNEGTIDNVQTRANVENNRLQGELPVYTSVDTTNFETGAGGIAGLNAVTGLIKNVTVSGAGPIKAGRGIGGVAAYNFGTIEFATVTATIPAGNQANSANSSNTYSYGGGIAGFNFGTIKNTAVTGRVFAQSAYAEAGNGNEGKNVGFGGIAGYNEGLITESSFARNLSAKEFIDKTRAQELGDVANNLGVASVHGDMYVGGIAGINKGQITSVYVGGAVIGARDFVGGITGLTLTGGSISNSYAFAEVAVKDNAGNKVTAANAKTTVTTYEIAPSGFDIASTFYKPLVNSETNETWKSGDYEAPKLPLFTQDDLTKVGNKFAASGVLSWQQGTVTGVNILLENAVLPFGAEVQLDYEVLPVSAPDLYTTWTSSNPEVVEVIGDGLIRGVGEGTATVTVTTRDGGHTDSITVTVENYTHVETVEVSAGDYVLPTPNDNTVRFDIEIGQSLTFAVNLLPLDATYKGYTITVSNSRATVDGNTINFVYGNTGPGNVSVVISFEDSSVAPLEYRFRTIEVVEEPDPEDILIDEVNVTAGDFELPEVNNADVRPQVEIGTAITLEIVILPENATNKTYTITVSNSRATVDGHTVTFVQGNGLGSVSIYIDFEDKSVGDGGRLNYRFETIAVQQEPDPEDILIDEVNVAAGDFELPNVNDSNDRQEVTIGTVFTLTIDILPVDATNKNYTVTSSQTGRATVEGLTFTVVGTGNFSVRIQFEDLSVGNSGLLEYRFLGVAAPVEPENILITEVNVTAGDFELPEVNNAAVRPQVEIGTVITLAIEILPLDASNKNYTITVSNSRATVDGHTITFVQGSGLGSVSIYIDFEDTSYGDAGRLNYRFETIAALVEEEEEVVTVTVSAGEFVLPEPNNSDVRPEVTIGTSISITVEFNPSDAENQNYTITVSNSRAQVSGNTVTFVQGSGAGNVSVNITFDDPNIPNLEYRFKTVQA